MGVLQAILAAALFAAGPVADKKPAASQGKDRSRPEIRLALSSGSGGFYSESVGWTRADVTLRLDLGLRVHPQVHANLIVGASMERFAALFQLGVTWFPWKRGFYCRGTVDLVLAGAGVQPGLSLAAGWAHYFRFPFGLFAEAQVSGRLSVPRTCEILGLGGVLTYF